MIDSSKQRWRVAGGGDEVVLPPSVDWAVALSAEGRERRVVVWVSRTAWALREGGDLPVDAQDAIQVKGLWAVERYLHWHEPPRGIETTTEGFKPTGGLEG